MKSLQKYKCILPLYSLMALRYIMHHTYDSLIVLRIWRISGFLKADCTGGWSQTHWEWVAKTAHCDLPRASVHPWHRLSQERMFQRPRKVLVGFQYSCLGDGGNWEVVYLALVWEGPSVVGLLRVEEQNVPISTTRSSIWVSLLPTHTLLEWLESQGVISSTGSPFKNPTLGAK